MSVKLLLCAAAGILCIKCRQRTLAFPMTADNMDSDCDMGTDCYHSCARSKTLPVVSWICSISVPLACTYFRSPVCHTADDAQDDSDYEDDGKAAALAPQVPPPDHDDYYGKGWQPSKLHDQAVRLADSTAGKDALCKRFTDVGCA